jgi:limonene-1,2-epoxide hydrolase
MSASDVVSSFLAAVVARDLDTAVTFLAVDVIYDNVPIGPVVGHEGVRGVLSGGTTEAADQIDWVIRYQVAQGNVVMNERIDRFHINGRWLEIPVAGVFVLQDSLISEWRDYFDPADFRRQREAVGL